MSVTEAEDIKTEPPHAPDGPGGTARIARVVAFNRIGAVYVWILLIIVFSIWAPDTFPTLQTAKQVLNSNAITAFAALGVTIPLCARVFDLSFAYVMTLTGVAAAHFLTHGVGLVPAIAIAIGIGFAMGVINAIVVVVMRIDSFIATLASGSLVQALISMITHDSPINGPQISGSFAQIAQTDIDGVTLPVIYSLVAALGVWYLLEHTATGRRLYATGFNPEASRLAGIGIDRLRAASLIVSGTLSGVCGIILAANLSSGDPTAGTPYLLPVFAAAFLGATQLKGGRFNAGGTIIAVLLLGTGVTGLGLASAPTWAGDMFVGVVLIASLAITGMQRRASVGGARRLRLWRRTASEPAQAGR
jgi:ribose transport system permease protein